MDRNSAIGLTLIAVLLVVYFYWFAPEPVPEPETPAQTEAQAPAQQDTVRQQVTAEPDSAMAAQFGDLSAFITGQEESIVVETEDLRVIFSNRGGVIRELELKKYKTYYQQPLKLIEPASTSFKLLTSYNGKEVDLYKLYYNKDLQKKNDTTFLSFTIALTDGSSFKQHYAIPDKGYEIGYRLSGTSGLTSKLAGD